MAWDDIGAAKGSFAWAVVWPFLYLITILCNHTILHPNLKTNSKGFQPDLLLMWGLHQAHEHVAWYPFQQQARVSYNKSHWEGGSSICGSTICWTRCNTLGENQNSIKESKWFIAQGWCLLLSPLDFCHLVSRHRSLIRVQSVPRAGKQSCAWNADVLQLRRKKSSTVRLGQTQCH